MNLDDVAAELRHREGAQALDMGLLLGRRLWWAIILPWLLLVVPILVVVQMTIGVVWSPWLAVVVGWWLKPLFDRVVLHVVSRGFFGDVPSTKQTVATAVGQWFSLRAVADLSWRRILGDRSVTMPVFLLEGNHRHQIGNRLKSLFDSQARGMGWLLAGMGLGLKGALYLSVVLLAVVMIPGQVAVDQFAALQHFIDTADPWVVTALVVAVTTVVTTAVEPFYMAAGFGIYIQRRIEREGWDLQIRFQRLADRVQESMGGSVAGLLVVGLAAAVAALVSAPAPVQAHQDDDAGYTEERVVGHQLAPHEDPQGMLDEMLDERPFSPPAETTEQWVPVHEMEDDEPWWERWDLEALTAGQQLLIQLLWVLLWVLFFGVVAVVVVKVLGVAGGKTVSSAQSERRAHWQEKLADRGVETTLPVDGDIAQFARQRWAEGRDRQALAAMLVSSLMAVEKRHHVDFPAGWTIERCARQVRGLSPEGPVLMALARAFDELVWAGRELSDRQFEQLWHRWNTEIAAGETDDE